MSSQGTMVKLAFDTAVALSVLCVTCERESLEHGVICIRISGFSICSRMEMVDRQRHQARVLSGVWPHDTVMTQMNTSNLVILSVTKRGVHAEPIYHLIAWRLGRYVCMSWWSYSPI